MKIVCEVQVDSGHPSLAGHFPGKPVVPAVVILERAMVEIDRVCPGCRVTGILHAKFLSPLRPGERMQLALRWKDAGSVRFDYSVGDKRIAVGEFDVKAETADGEHP